ncbi:MAG: hypothetical protein KF723_21595 [Rhizobiaceae bacterium]|nr:hypothetical protein [Rhizobiaceae bacterium]
MDPVTISFYAVVCGSLAILSPRIPTAVLRLVVGIAAGVAGASLLPFIRASLGI